jgi:hypothetical protein
VRSHIASTSFENSPCQCTIKWCQRLTLLLSSTHSVPSQDFVNLDNKLCEIKINQTDSHIYKHNALFFDQADLLLADGTVFCSKTRTRNSIQSESIKMSRRLRAKCSHGDSSCGGETGGGAGASRDATTVGEPNSKRVCSHPTSGSTTKICGLSGHVGEHVDPGHVHHANCGHQQVLHDGHFDYLVDNELHHQDKDACTVHGELDLQSLMMFDEDTSFGDFLNQLPLSSSFHVANDVTAGAPQSVSTPPVPSGVALLAPPSNSPALSLQ